MIHTFGDSHSKFGWNYCKNVTTHHLGPVLCYSFGKEKLKRCDISKYNIKNGDSVIFSFGEIDCRCHVIKHVTDKKSYQMIIDELIENYCDAIQFNVATCDARLKHVSVFNIPPTPLKSTVSGQDKAKTPLLGTDEERKLYGMYFNDKMRAKCKENNWIFFDVYEAYSKNGFLNQKLSDGNVHLLCGEPLAEFVINNFR